MWRRRRVPKFGCDCIAEIYGEWVDEVGTYELDGTTFIDGAGDELEVCALSGVRCPPGQSAFFDPARGAIVRQSLGGRGLLLSGATRAALVEARGATWSEVRLEGAERAQARALLEAFVSAQIR